MTAAGGDGRVEILYENPWGHVESTVSRLTSVLVVTLLCMANGAQGGTPRKCVESCFLSSRVKLKCFPSWEQCCGPCIQLFELHVAHSLSDRYFSMDFIVFSKDFIAKTMKIH